MKKVSLNLQHSNVWVQREYNLIKTSFKFFFKFCCKFDVLPFKYFAILYCSYFSEAINIYAIFPFFFLSLSIRFFMTSTWRIQKFDDLQFVKTERWILSWIFLKFFTEQICLWTARVNFSILIKKAQTEFYFKKERW